MTVKKLNATKVMVMVDAYDLKPHGVNEFTFNGYKLPIEGIFEIPHSLFGRTVTAIGKGAFENISSVSEFVIPSSVKMINRFAFQNVGNAVIRFKDRSHLQNNQEQFFDDYWNPQNNKVIFWDTSSSDLTCNHSNYQMVAGVKICNTCHNKQVQKWIAPTLNQTTNILVNANKTLVDVFIRYRKSINSSLIVISKPMITNLLPGDSFSIPHEYLVGGEADVQFKQPGQSNASQWTRVINKSIIPVKPTFIGSRTIRNDSSMTVKMRIDFIDTGGGSSDGPYVTYIMQQNGKDIILNPGQSYRIPNYYFDYWYGFNIRFETIDGLYFSESLSLAHNSGWIVPFSIVDFGLLDY